MELLAVDFFYVSIVQGFFTIIFVKEYLERGKLQNNWNITRFSSFLELRVRKKSCRLD